jgi:hypothetical protein
MTYESIAVIVHDILTWGTELSGGISELIIFIEQIITIFTPTAWTGASFWDYVIVALVSGLLQSIHQGFTYGASYLSDTELTDTSTFTSETWLIYTIVEAVVTVVQSGLYFVVEVVADAIEKWWISVGGA